MMKIEKSEYHIDELINYDAPPTTRTLSYTYEKSLEDVITKKSQIAGARRASCTEKTTILKSKK